MSNISIRDKVVIRDLAKRYIDVCKSDRNKLALDLWNDHNSMIQTRPPVLVCSFWDVGKDIDENLEENKTESLGWVENWFKRQIWQSTFIDDDTVFYPWFTMDSIRRARDDFWGYELNLMRDKASGGYRSLPLIKEIEDLDKLKATPHEVIDRNPPEVALMRDVLEGILPVHVVTSTVYPRWGGTDLSEALGKLVGLQEFMLMMYDKPEIIHKLMSFMRNAVLANIEKGEADGDWTTVDGWSYAVNNTRDLPQPKANSYGAKLKDLWCFTHAQEFEPVGPMQHEEFLLQYQMPIMKKFGLVSYGCCETLDNKIELLRKIPNLRSIGIGPRSNIKKCADQIGRDYIMSWRPNPAMVSSDYNIDNCRRIVRKGFEETRGCNIHLMLKEIMTIENDPQRLIDFAKMAKEEAMNFKY